MSGLLISVVVFCCMAGIWAFYKLYELSIKLHQEHKTRNIARQNKVTNFKSQNPELFDAINYELIIPDEYEVKPRTLRYKLNGALFKMGCLVFNTPDDLMGVLDTVEYSALNEFLLDVYYELLDSHANDLKARDVAVRTKVLNKYKTP